LVRGAQFNGRHPSTPGNQTKDAHKEFGGVKAAEEKFAEMCGVSMNPNRAATRCWLLSPTTARGIKDR
jgi:hypothetical protein